MEDVYKSMCICGNFIYKDNILNHCNCADKFRRDSAQTISELESDRQAWKDNCSDQDEIINELEERNKRLKDDYDIHIKALALRADKIEELEKTLDNYRKYIYAPLMCCKVEMDFTFGTLTTPEYYQCPKCKHKIERHIELLTKKDGG